VDESTNKHHNNNKFPEKTGKGEEECSFQDGPEAETAVVESPEESIDKYQVIIDITKKMNDFRQRVIGLSTELVMERQKYLELDEKYAKDTSELKQRVSTLTTQLDREQQKTIKLEKNLLLEEKERMKDVPLCHFQLCVR
ncbi:hypothetical protein PMAYCL1PPCAC_20704, partial [Pristionchus mayeri]